MMNDGSLAFSFVGNNQFNAASVLSLLRQKYPEARMSLTENKIIIPKTNGELTVDRVRDSIAEIPGLRHIS